jgi:hypothetical protein
MTALVLVLVGVTAGDNDRGMMGAWEVVVTKPKLHVFRFNDEWEVSVSVYSGQYSVEADPRRGTVQLRQLRGGNFSCSLQVFADGSYIPGLGSGGVLRMRGDDRRLPRSVLFTDPEGEVLHLRLRHAARKP